MKRSFLIAFFALLYLAVGSFGQSLSDYTSEMILLEPGVSTRSDVIAVYGRGEPAFDGASKKIVNAIAKFEYVTVVREGMAVEVLAAVEIDFENPIRFSAEPTAALGRQWSNEAGLITYYDDKNSLVYKVRDDSVESIELIPTEAKAALSIAPANPPYAEGVAIFTVRRPNPLLMVRRRRLPSPKLRVDVIMLTVDRHIISSCLTSMSVSVAVGAAASDPDDVLTYNYSVSGGRIVGMGPSVAWDLTGVKPGEYEIIVAADNGCGVCGSTKTEKVTVTGCDKK